MAVVQILDKQYKGLSSDTKPTGVILRSIFRETDTGAEYITYDGTNWVVADERHRLTNEDGAFIDIPGEFDAVIAAI